MNDAKKFQANRDSIRAQVIPTEIRGLIKRHNSDGHEPLLLWDVAVNGLGVWCSAELKAGELLKVTLGKPHPLVVNCKVMWVEKQNNGGFRAGLQATEDSPKLAALYQLFCETKPT